MPPDHFWDFMEEGDLSKFARREKAQLTYEQVYRNLDGMIALLVARGTWMKKIKGEKDTAFVKRIVAHYIVEAARAGAHDLTKSIG